MAIIKSKWVIFRLQIRNCIFGHHRAIGPRPRYKAGTRHFGAAHWAWPPRSRVASANAWPASRRRRPCRPGIGLRPTRNSRTGSSHHRGWSCARRRSDAPGTPAGQTESAWRSSWGPLANSFLYWLGSPKATSSSCTWHRPHPNEGPNARSAPRWRGSSGFH